MHYFPYGRAAFCILILAVLSGGWLSFHTVAEHPATLVYWTSTKPHYDSYKLILPEFEREHPGVTVDLELVSGGALAPRMQAAMLANLDVPDLFEIGIGDAGTLLRGPTKEIGLLDLTSRVHAPLGTGLPSFYGLCVANRFAPYTRDGHIYGLPHDVHPVQLAYRRDMFAKYGVDPSQIKTWDDFVRIGRRMTLPGRQYMLEASDSDTNALEAMLFQRGGDYFDASGNVSLDSDIAVKTLCWYVPLVAGPNKIADSLGFGTAAEVRAVEDGYMLCYICPDWRSKTFEEQDGRLAGKMGLMPLPAVAPGTRPTSTFGGTMVGITKHCANPDFAWQLAMFLDLNAVGVDSRFRATNILPPIRSQWNMPVFHEPRAYWHNQRLGDAYARLAPQAPPRHSSPAIAIAEGKLGQALVHSVRYYDSHGYPPQNDPAFVAYVRAELKSQADSVRAAIARSPY